MRSAGLMGRWESTVAVWLPWAAIALLAGSGCAYGQEDGGALRQREAELRMKLQRSPKDTEVLRGLAEVMERTGRTRADVGLRREVLAGAVGEAEVERARTELAVALVEAGESAEAIPLLEGVVKQQPGNEVAWFELGTAQARREAFAEALPAFERAVTLRPGDAQAQLSTAKTLVTLLRYAEAEPYLEAAAKGGAAPLEVHQLRGVVYRYTGREAMAVGEFAEAARLQPADAAIELQLLRAHRRR